ncbi:hypothetical protein PAPYR_6948 [Paratrimastix pyriformis]|uniref:Uncharacterized protein n=1 Tax=Paratrimastix pyriformis TaxID=342808 RepID=A0ABQ8UE75_9EUKA|nr:hypothetical protein PAPYR_6948 [Paratrimastix pyriformis]
MAVPTIKAARTKFRGLLEQFESDDQNRERIMGEIIASLRSIVGVDDEESRTVLTQFFNFMRDKVNLMKLFPRLGMPQIDSFIESLLMICNTNPSPTAADAMIYLTSMLMEDEQLLIRFKPTKANLMKMCLPLYIQGSDRNLRRHALSFVLHLLSVAPNIDLEDITNDQQVIDRISWAERRQCWERMNKIETNITQLQQDSSAQQQALDVLSHVVELHDTQLTQVMGDVDKLLKDSTAHDARLAEQATGLKEQADRLGAGLREQSEALGAGLKAQAERFEAQAKEQADRVGALQAAHDETRRAAEALQKTALETDRRIKSLEELPSRFGALQDMFTAQRATLDGLSATNIRHQLALDEDRLAVTQQGGELARLQGDMRRGAEATQAELARLQAAGNESREAIKTLGSRLEGQAEGQRATNTRVQVVQEELTQAKMALRPLDEATRQLGRTADGHEKQLNKLGPMVDELGQASSEQRQALESLQREHEAVMKQLAFLTDVTPRELPRLLAGLTQQCQEALSRTTATEDEGARQGATLQAHTDTLQNIIRATEAAGARLDQMQQVREELRRALAMAEEEHRISTNETRLMIDRLQTGATETDKRLTEMQGLVAAFKSFQEEYERTHNSLQGKLEELHHSQQVVSQSTAEQLRSVTQAQAQEKEFFREELMQNRHKVEEATQFLAHEAETKMKDLALPTTDLRSRLNILAWVSLHHEWMHAEAIMAALGAFIEWADTTGGLRKCTESLETAVRHTLGQLDQYSKQEDQFPTLELLLKTLEALMRAEPNQTVSPARSRRRTFFDPSPRPHHPVFHQTGGGIRKMCELLGHPHAPTQAGSMLVLRLVLKAGLQSFAPASFAWPGRSRELAL